MAETKKTVVKKYSLRKVIFFPVSAIFLGAIIFGLVDPSGFFNLENAITQFGFDYFGWLYVMVTVASMGILAWLYFGKHGNIVIGGPKAEPFYKKKWHWFAVVLCGTIGTGMVIWGVCEPAIYFSEPVPGVWPALTPRTQEAAVYGMGTILLHWGFPAIALYTIMGVVVGFAVYNMKLPLRVSSIAYPLLGKKCNGAFGNLIDLFSCFAIAVSVATVLMVGTTTLSAGFDAMTGVPSGLSMQAIILILLVVTYIISSCTGLLKGVKILSNINTYVFIALVGFVLIFGGTRFIAVLSTESLGAQFDMFFSRMTYLGAVNGDQWPKWWTVNYWLFMIVYGPMMGMFFAKIGRGRSIKEFISVHTLSAIFIIAWFCIFGSATINIEMNTDASIYAASQALGNEAAVFEFFKHFPLTQVTSILFIGILFLSIVTMGDGLVTSVAAMSINSDEGAVAEPPRKLKIFWGVVMASIAFVSIFSNTASEDGINMLMAARMLPMIGAMPMLIVYIIGIFSVFKIFGKDNISKYNTAYDPEQSIVEPELRQNYEISDYNYED